MDDGESIAIYWPLYRLWHKIVHQAEDRRGQEEAHGSVPVPPLHQRILYAAEDRVAMREARRDREVIHDVEQRNGDHRGDVEPDGHIEARLVPAGEGPEEIDREDD